MLKQQESLNIIAKCLHMSAPKPYDSAILTYRILGEDEQWTSFSATYMVKGKKTPPKDIAILQEEIEPLLEKLHTEMKLEKNSDWRKIELTIDENKKVHVHFDYSMQEM